MIMIHHDVDGVLREFHSYSMDFFFKRHPEYKKYRLSPDKFRGWGFKEQLKKVPVATEIDKIMWHELFEDPETSYFVFSTAPAIVSPEEWKHHVSELKRNIPNCHIVISTHQYTDGTKKGTMDWLIQNKFTDGDDVSILITGEKHRFGAHFLLDDKPKTIERFHKPFKSIGVLRKHPSANTWFFNKHYKGQFPIANSLEDYRKIIFDHYIELL